MCQFVYALIKVWFMIGYRLCYQQYQKQYGKLPYLNSEFVNKMAHFAGDISYEFHSMKKIIVLSK